MKSKTSKALSVLLGAVLSVSAMPSAWMTAAAEEKVDISHGTFSSSPSYAGYEGRAMDGDLSSQWAAKGAGECWLQADFDSPITFNCIRVYETTTYGERLVGAKLETSETGEENSWTTVQEFPNLANGVYNEDLMLEEPLCSSHVRLVLDGGTKEINVNEVEFYLKEITARDELGTLIDSAKGIDRRIYTIQSSRTLALAIASAQVVYNNESMLDGQIEDAKRILQEAIDGLTPFGENLALEADASANSTYEGSYDQDSYGPEFTVDGNLATRWASKDEADGFVFEITLDLKEAKTFNQVVVHETQAYQGRIKTIHAQISEDGENWTDWRMNAEHYAPTSSLVADPVTARYVRVQMEENGATTGMNVDEIQVYLDEEAIETSSLTPARPVDPSWIAPVPSSEANTYQLRKQKLGYGMFIHYGVNTFTNNEWGNGREDVSVFNPDAETYDPEQWAKTAYEAGMNYVVLITKHHDGFAMFDSQYTDHKVTNCGHESVDFDVVDALSKACKKYGIKLGLYYSIWDMNWEQNHPQSNYIDLRAWDQAYTDYAYNQIEELMTNYGEICELWIDGGWQKETPRWEYERIYDMVKRHQPGCQMSVNLTMGDRDIASLQGGEEIVNFPSDFKLYDGRDTAASGDPKVFTYQGENYYLPFEGTFIIGNGWFWNTNSAASNLRVNADQIQSWYDKYIEQQNTLVINVPPSNKGVQTEHEISLINEAARKIGIARGEARGDKQENECEVEIRYLTTEGEIAAPTVFLYGQAGEAYQTAGMEDADELGYTLQSVAGNTEGVFGSERITVEYIYNDDLKNPVTETADKTLLQEAIAYAKEANTDHLNPLVAAALQQTIEEAEAVMADPAALQSRVNEAWKKLISMIHMLSFTTDKTALADLVNQAQALDLVLYEDDEAMAEFREALIQAEEVLASETALDEVSIAPALIRLQNAMAGLHEKPVQELDLGLLNLLIETVQNTDLDQYVENGKEEFTSALEQALAVKDQPDSQEQINEATAALHSAWLNLRLAASEDLIRELTEALNTLQVFALRSDDPQLISFCDFINPVLAAHKNGTAKLSQKEAEDLLREAREKTEKAQQKPSAEDETTKPAIQKPVDSADPDQKQSAAEKAQTPSEKPANSVKTAAASAAGFFGLLAGGSLISALSISRRRRRK